MIVERKKERKKERNFCKKNLTVRKCGSKRKRKKKARKKTKNDE